MEEFQSKMVWVESPDGQKAVHLRVIPKGSEIEFKLVEVGSPAGNQLLEGIRLATASTKAAQAAQAA